MNCGVCTAICPAAEFYNYDPRVIVETVQRGNEEEIEELLKSDTIWYCGECMSCKTRCPRCNTPGLVIMALRKISQELGYFVYSEKGRQQYALKHVIGESILKRGYCVTPDLVKPECTRARSRVGMDIRASGRRVRTYALKLPSTGSRCLTGSGFGKYG